VRREHEDKHDNSDQGEHEGDGWPGLASLLWRDR
jgi:hypothetical protein